jgi:hypothetical protein
MKNRKFDIEDAYQIFVLFMQHFWWDFLRYVMAEKGLINEGLTPEEFDRANSDEQGKSELAEANYFVFNIVTGDPSGCADYLEQIIEKTLNIKSTRKLKNFTISEEILFQLIVDFCIHFNSQFKSYPEDSICFAINWLEDMRKHPEEHKQEWNMWNECIQDVIIEGYKSSANFST